MDLIIAFGDSEMARATYALIHPHVNDSGATGTGLVFLSGSAHWPLGRLAALLGRTEEALGHFAAAVTIDTRLGARPLIALTRLDWAGVLKTRAARGDYAQARTLAWQAATEARRLDMPGPAGRAEHLVNDLEQAIRAGDPLTPREREIADLVSAGITNRAIASQLVLSERTVEGHVRSILAKLQLTNRTELAAWTLRGPGPSESWLVLEVSSQASSVAARLAEGVVEAGDEGVQAEVEGLVGSGASGGRGVGRLGEPGCGVGVDAGNHDGRGDEVKRGAQDEALHRGDHREHHVAGEARAFQGGDRFLVLGVHDGVGDGFGGQHTDGAGVGGEGLPVGGGPAAQGLVPGQLPERGCVDRAGHPLAQQRDDLRAAIDMVVDGGWGDLQRPGEIQDGEIASPVGQSQCRVGDAVAVEQRGVRAAHRVLPSKLNKFKFIS